MNQLPEEFQGVKFETEIKEVNAERIHVLHLKRTHLAHAKKYVTDARVGIYSIQAWKGMKDNLGLLGYEHNYVIHSGVQSANDLVAEKNKEAAAEAEAKAKAETEAKQTEIQKVQDDLGAAIEELKIAKEGGDKKEITAAEAKAKELQEKLEALNK